MLIFLSISCVALLLISGALPAIAVWDLWWNNRLDKIHRTTLRRITIEFCMQQGERDPELFNKH